MCNTRVTCTVGNVHLYMDAHTHTHTVISHSFFFLTQQTLERMGLPELNAKPAGLVQEHMFFTVQHTPQGNHALVDHMFLGKRYMSSTWTLTAETVVYT